MKLGVSQLRGQAAHTLPEAVIAALVVGLMVVSLYAGFSSGFGLLRSSREDLRATQIIMSRMESLRLYTWAQLHDPQYLPAKFTEYYDPTPSSDQTNGVMYMGSIIAKPPSDTSPLQAVSYRSNILDVTIKVFWTNQVAGQEYVRSRKMETYVSRYGHPTK